MIPESGNTACRKRQEDTADPVQADALSLHRITCPSPEFLDTAVNWLYPWWGEPEGYLKEEVRTMIENSCEEERFPRTFCLFLGERPIGMFMLTLSDMDIRPNLYPWLANLYIDPAFRGKDYSAFLISSVEREAKKAGIRELYLYTYHTGLYERYGWEFSGTVDTFRKTPRIQRLYRLHIR